MIIWFGSLMRIVQSGRSDFVACDLYVYFITNKALLYILFVVVVVLFYITELNIIAKTIVYSFDKVFV